MDQPSFTAAFKGSRMKRTKRRALARNAVVLFGNVDTGEKNPTGEAILAHDEPLVRDHAERALDVIGTTSGRRRDAQAAPPAT